MLLTSYILFNEDIQQRNFPKTEKLKSYKGASVKKRREIAEKRFSL